METPDVSARCAMLMLMAKSDSERGPFGAWLVKERKARPGKGRDGRMTAAQVREWLIRDRGFGIGESAYAELESGTALPSAEQRRHLSALFGSEPPGAVAAAAPDTAALLEAIAAQQDTIAEQGRQIADLTGLVKQLIGQVEAERDAVPKWAKAAVQAALAGHQLREATGGSST